MDDDDFDMDDYKSDTADYRFDNATDYYRFGAVDFIPFKLKNGRQAFQDKKGNISPDTYLRVKDYGIEYAPVKLDLGTWALRDLQGNLSKDTYKSIYWGDEFLGYCKVKLNKNQDAYRSKDGKLITTSEYDIIYDIHRNPSHFLKLKPELFKNKELINLCLNTIKDTLVGKIKYAKELYEIQNLYESSRTLLQQCKAKVQLCNQGAQALTNEKEKAIKFITDFSCEDK